MRNNCQFMYFNGLTVKDRPTLQYNFLFMLLWFCLMMVDTNGRNMLYKVNKWTEFNVLCLLLCWKSDFTKISLLFYLRNWMLQMWNHIYMYIFVCVCVCVCVCVNTCACKSVKFKSDYSQFSCTCVMINIRLILQFTIHSTGLLQVLTAAQNS